MICAWQAFVELLPPWMRGQTEVNGKQSLQELRLRQGELPQLICVDGLRQLDRIVVAEDLRYIVNAASQYSPWASATVARGYITAPGGHRLGLCGQVVINGGAMTGIRDVTSLCIRVARDFHGISRGADPLGSVLIIGSPGSGKTTFLRDMIRARSDLGRGSVAVVDEREEIFPYWNGEPCFPAGKGTDVLRGCGKEQGVECVLRTMGPAAIAVDEITARADCRGLLQAGWCGVDLLATAHAGSVEDLLSRPVYRPIVEAGLFERVVVLRRDKSWKLERMVACT